MSKIETGHSSLVGAFRAHKKVIGDTPTHHMILFYAVECGLKAMACSPNYGGRLRSISDITLEKGGAATTHRLNDLVNHLRLPAAMGKCPDLKASIRGVVVDVKHGEIHQAWRYGVKIDPSTEAEAVGWLKKMVTVIESKI